MFVPLCSFTADQVVSPQEGEKALGGNGGFHPQHLQLLFSGWINIPVNVSSSGAYFMSLRQGATRKSSCSIKVWKDWNLSLGLCLLESLSEGWRDTFTFLISHAGTGGGRSPGRFKCVFRQIILHQVYNYCHYTLVRCLPFLIHRVSMLNQNININNSLIRNYSAV